MTLYKDYFLEWIKIIAEVDGIAFSKDMEADYEHTFFVLLYNGKKAGSIEFSAANLTDGATITVQLYV